MHQAAADPVLTKQNSSIDLLDATQKHSPRRRIGKGASVNAPEKHRREEDRQRTRQMASMLIRAKSDRSLLNTASPPKRSPAKPNKPRPSLEGEYLELKLDDPNCVETKTDIKQATLISEDEDLMAAAAANVPNFLRKVSKELLVYLDEGEDSEEEDSEEEDYAEENVDDAEKRASFPCRSFSSKEINASPTRRSWKSTTPRSNSVRAIGTEGTSAET